jgi:FAD/FMN-containing dehydrogenase
MRSGPDRAAPTEVATVNYRSAGWDPGFTPQDVAALASVTEGPVLVAGDPGLADELSCPDVAILHGPDVAVGATNPADVQAAVRFAADFRLPLAVMAPGHHASPKTGVLVTTGRMARIHLDRRSRTAIAEAGALWSDLVDRAAELGLAPLVPSYPGMGIVGRTFGWTAGHVRSIQVVTADGEFRHVTAAGDPRLFRLLCASEPGDVGLGIITAMEFALFR